MDDESGGVSDLGHENACVLHEHHEDDLVSNRWSPFGLQTACGGKRKFSCKWNVSRLQPLVPTWSSRLMEPASVCYSASLTWFLALQVSWKSLVTCESVS